MELYFSETLKRLRTERGLSQQQLADMLHVSRSTVAKWETGDRMADVPTLSLLTEALNADITVFYPESNRPYEMPNVILVDDERIVLKGIMSVLEESLPDTNIKGFLAPHEALSYARENPVALAFVDIEMGNFNGFDLCSKLQEINPRTDVIYLTAYPGYALNAWETGACGFLVKPLTKEKLRHGLSKLRFPLSRKQKGADEA